MKQSIKIQLLRLEKLALTIGLDDALVSYYHKVLWHEDIIEYVSRQIANQHLELGLNFNLMKFEGVKLPHDKDEGILIYDWCINFLNTNYRSKITVNYRYDYSQIHLEEFKEVEE